MDGLPLRIRELRGERGLSQAALADIVGVRPHSISRMEAGAFKPSASTLLRLARALGVDPYELAGMSVHADSVASDAATGEGPHA